MFARVTQFKMKPGSKDTATAMMNTLKSQIMGLPGMIHFINVMNEDGSGFVIAVVESEETSNANTEKVQGIWAAFAEHLEGPPSPQGFDVVANWAN